MTVRTDRAGRLVTLRPGLGAMRAVAAFRGLVQCEQEGSVA